MECRAAEAEEILFLLAGIVRQHVDLLDTGVAQAVFDVGFQVKHVMGGSRGRHELDGVSAVTHDEALIKFRSHLVRALADGGADGSNDVGECGA